MHAYLLNLNNREWSAIVWISLLLLSAFVASTKMRQAAARLLKAFFVRSIIFSILSMLLYIAMIVGGLSALGIWEQALLKDTIIWVFGVALVMLFNASNAMRDSQYFSKAVKDSIKVAVVIEYFINFFVFSLWVEFMTFPIILLATCLTAYAEAYEREPEIKKLANFLIGIYGVTVLAFTIINAVKYPDLLLNITNIKSIMLPILLTLAYLPFAYFFALYLEYDRIFSVLRMLNNDAGVIRHAKRVIFYQFHFNLLSLGKWHRAGNLLKFKNTAEINEMFNNRKHTV